MSKFEGRGKRAVVWVDHSKALISYEHARPIPTSASAWPAHLVLANGNSAGSELAALLRDHGVAVSVANDRTELLRALARDAPDLVILGRYFGRTDGLDLLREIRRKSEIPVIVTDARHAEDMDRIVGLELGADDYLTKPFPTRELLARVRAVLRRSDPETMRLRRPEKRRRYAFKDWVFDQRLCRIEHSDGNFVRLTKGESALLSVFMTTPRQPLSRIHLLKATRLHEDIFDRSIDVQVLRLRRKLSDKSGAEAPIRTERGSGYILDADVQAL